MIIRDKEHFFSVLGNADPRLPLGDRIGSLFVPWGDEIVARGSVKGRLVALFARTSGELQKKMVAAAWRALCELSEGEKKRKLTELYSGREDRVLGELQRRIQEEKEAVRNSSRRGEVAACEVREARATLEGRGLKGDEYYLEFQGSKELLPEFRGACEEEKALLEKLRGGDRATVYREAGRRLAQEIEGLKSGERKLIKGSFGLRGRLLHAILNLPEVKGADPREYLEMAEGLRKKLEPFLPKEERRLPKALRALLPSFLREEIETLMEGSLTGLAADFLGVGTEKYVALRELVKDEQSLAAFSKSIVDDLNDQVAGQVHKLTNVLDGMTSLNLLNLTAGYGGGGEFLFEWVREVDGTLSLTVALSGSLSEHGENGLVLRTRVNVHSPKFLGRLLELSLEPAFDAQFTAPAQPFLQAFFQAAGGERQTPIPVGLDVRTVSPTDFPLLYVSRRLTKEQYAEIKEQKYLGALNTLFPGEMKIQSAEQKGFVEKGYHKIVAFYREAGRDVTGDATYREIKLALEEYEEEEKRIRKEMGWAADYPSFLMRALIERVQDGTLTPKRIESWSQFFGAVLGEEFSEFMGPLVESIKELKNIELPQRVEAASLERREYRSKIIQFLLSGYIQGAIWMISYALNALYVLNLASAAAKTSPIAALALLAAWGLVQLTPEGVYEWFYDQMAALETWFVVQLCSFLISEDEKKELVAEVKKFLRSLKKTEFDWEVELPPDEETVVEEGDSGIARETSLADFSSVRLATCFQMPPEGSGLLDALKKWNFPPFTISRGVSRAVASLSVYDSRWDEIPLQQIPDALQILTEVGEKLSAWEISESSPPESYPLFLHRMVAQQEIFILMQRLVKKRGGEQERFGVHLISKSFLKHVFGPQFSLVEPELEERLCAVVQHYCPEIKDFSRKNRKKNLKIVADTSKKAARRAYQSHLLTLPTVRAEVERRYAAKKDQRSKTWWQAYAKRVAESTGPYVSEKIPQRKLAILDEMCLELNATQFGIPLNWILLKRQHYRAKGLQAKELEFLTAQQSHLEEKRRKGSQDKYFDRFSPPRLSSKAHENYPVNELLEYSDIPSELFDGIDDLAEGTGLRDIADMIHEPLAMEAMPHDVKVELELAQKHPETSLTRHLALIRQEAENNTVSRGVVRRVYKELFQLGELKRQLRELEEAPQVVGEWCEDLLKLYNGREESYRIQNYPLVILIAQLRDYTLATRPGDSFCFPDVAERVMAMRFKEKPDCYHHLLLMTLSTQFGRLSDAKKEQSAMGVLLAVNNLEGFPSQYQFLQEDLQGVFEWVREKMSDEDAFRNRILNFACKAVLEVEVDTSWSSDGIGGYTTGEFSCTKNFEFRQRGVRRSPSPAVEEEVKAVPVKVKTPDLFQTYVKNHFGPDFTVTAYAKKGEARVSTLVLEGRDLKKEFKVEENGEIVDGVTGGLLSTAIPPRGLWYFPHTLSFETPSGYKYVLVPSGQGILSLTSRILSPAGVEGTVPYLLSYLQGEEYIKDFLPTTLSKTVYEYSIDERGRLDSKDPNAILELLIAQMLAGKEKEGERLYHRLQALLRIGPIRTDLLPYFCAATKLVSRGTEFRQKIVALVFANRMLHGNGPNESTNGELASVLYDIALEEVHLSPTEEWYFYEGAAQLLGLKLPERGRELLVDLLFWSISPKASARRKLLNKEFAKRDPLPIRGESTSYLWSGFSHLASKIPLPKVGDVLTPTAEAAIHEVLTDQWLGMREIPVPFGWKKYNGKLIHQIACSNALHVDSESVLRFFFYYYALIQQGNEELIQELEPLQSGSDPLTGILVGELLNIGWWSPSGEEIFRILSQQGVNAALQRIRGSRFRRLLEAVSYRASKETSSLTQVGEVPAPPLPLSPEDRAKIGEKDQEIARKIEALVGETFHPAGEGTYRAPEPKALVELQAGVEALLTSLKHEVCSFKRLLKTTPGEERALVRSANTRYTLETAYALAIKGRVMQLERILAHLQAGETEEALVLLLMSRAIDFTNDVQDLLSAYMLFEAKQGELLWEGQVSRLRASVHSKQSQVIEFIMGKGKTSKIKPIKNLEALSPETLVSNMWPEASHKVNSAMMVQTMFETLEIHQNMFRIDRGFGGRQRLQALFVWMFHMTRQGEALNITKHDWQCLESLFIDVLLQGRKEEAEILRKILRLNKKVGVAFIDEVHAQFSHVERLDLPVGPPQILPYDYWEPLKKILERLAEEKDLIRAVQEGTTRRFLGEKYGALKEQLAIEWSNGNNAVKDFLLGTATEIPEEHPEYRALCLCKGVLKDLLPGTLELDFHVHYSFSDQDHHIHPAKGNMSCNEEAEFNLVYQILLRTFIGFLADGLSNERLTLMIHQIKEIVAKEPVIEAELRKIPAFDTFLHPLTSKAVFNRTLKGFDFDGLRHNRFLILVFMTHIVLPGVKYWVENITNNPQTLARIFHHYTGFTGTPYNRGTYPFHEFLEDAGTLERAKATLLSRCTEEPITVLESDLPSAILGEIEGKFQDNDYALLDVGAVFKGIPNRKVAAVLLANASRRGLKGVLFFEKGELRCMLVSTGKDVPAEEAKLRPEERLTYYDQVNCLAMHIPQPPHSAGVIAYRKGLLSFLLQTAFRMRKLDKNELLLEEGKDEAGVYQRVRFWVPPSHAHLSTPQAIVDDAEEFEKSEAKTSNLEATVQSLYAVPRTKALEVLYESDRLGEKFEKLMGFLVEKMSDDPIALWGVIERVITPEEKLKDIFNGILCKLRESEGFSDREMREIEKELREILTPPREYPETVLEGKRDFNSSLEVHGALQSEARNQLHVENRAETQLALEVYQPEVAFHPTLPWPDLGRIQKWADLAGAPIKPAGSPLPESFYVSKNFLPDEVEFGSPAQRPVGALLVFSSLQGVNTLLLNPDEVKSWKEELDKRPRVSGISLWDPRGRIVLAGEGAGMTTDRKLDEVNEAEVFTYMISGNTYLPESLHEVAKRCVQGDGEGFRRFHRDILQRRQGPQAGFLGVWEAFYRAPRSLN